MLLFRALQTGTTVVLREYVVLQCKSSKGLTPPKHFSLLLLILQFFLYQLIKAQRAARSQRYIGLVLSYRCAIGGTS